MSSEVQEQVTLGDEAADHREVQEQVMVGDEAADHREAQEQVTAGDEAADHRDVSLFTPEVSHELRGQWDATQTAFVDDPRAALERADHLVVETIQMLSSSFTQERSQLEKQWARGENVSTEDLRLAFQRYRSFFDRLLSV